MLLSSIPYKFLEIFGKSASATYLTTPLPQTTGSGIRASQDLGFPPATATPIGSGGTPPDIRDFNGVLQYETAWSQWIQAGAPIGYDGTFSTAIGGYPNGAVIAAATVGAYWMSEIDNNTSDPDTGGANWIGLTPKFNGIQVFTTAGTFTVPPGGACEVEVWGAGGGSGGTSGAGSGSGAGAGGGYARKIITGLTPGATVSVTVGVGGIAGNSTPTSGGAGGSSAFGSYVSATGGNGGTGATGAVASLPVTPGTGTGGDLNLTGGQPTQPFALSGGIIYGACGGQSPGVPAQNQGWSSSSNPGSPGQTPGGGASGAVNGGVGAIGGNGKVIVRW